jgi:hypothetical protein
MSFYINHSYKFSIPDSCDADGGLILASGLAMHTLVRRDLDKYSNLEHRIFDPQLYLSSLDVNSNSASKCVNLSTYPWFNVERIDDYDSGVHNQKKWKDNALSTIKTRWVNKPPPDANVISDLVKYCIDFQLELNCDLLVLPSPLTVDPNTYYNTELMWLDSALDYIDELDLDDIPVYATIAISDICLRYIEPEENSFLDLVLDNLSAREIDGVYLVVEQAGEPNDTRLCANTRVLESILKLVYLFSEDSNIDVGVNYIGPFGLVCRAVGAKWWVSDWYKSTIRLRLADFLSTGRAHPNFWSFPSGIEIHLESDFDTLVNNNLIDQIMKVTVASEGLYEAASNGISVSNVPAWQYRPSNVASAIEHYLNSQIMSEQEIGKMSPKKRLNYIDKWLSNSSANIESIVSILGLGMKTRVDHVQNWNQALQSFKANHDL